MGHPLTESMRRLMPPEARKALGKAGLTADECAAKCDHDLELKLHGEVANYLRQKEPPIKYLHANPTKRSRMTVGWPDFTLAVKGRAVAFELKGPTGKLSEEQEECRRGMEANGWVYIVVQNLGQVRTVIEDIERSEG